MLLYYRILGVDETAGDETIRSKYLQLVKEHPPEKDPEKFRLINRAYEALKDERQRVRTKLSGFGSYRFWKEALDDLVATVGSERRSPGLEEIVGAQTKDNGRI
ncbi:MAG: J domain-containing protein [Desulfarculaceae bacterium]|nr:J domain-containing protein [Desulfarculaceae bacterium]